MKNIFVIALFFLLAGTKVQAAGLDCTQALSTPETIICKSDELSELDTQLDETYRFSIAKASLRKANSLATEQRQWLNDIRNHCTDAGCLLQVYKTRLNELNPFSDNKITCDEMRQSTDFIFSNGMPDLGSGRASPVEVDYECAESLSQQNFMRRLINLAEEIRGEDGPHICNGTLIFAQWRYYHFDLASAGFAPKIFLQGPSTSRTPIDWSLVKDADGNDSDKQVIRYFKQWSESSRSSLVLYSDFTSEFDRVLPILAKHYQTNFGLSEKDAKIVARSALMLVLQRAAGGFPRQELRKESTLLRAVRNSRADYKDIRRELGSERGSPTPYSKDEIYNALIVALINNRSLQIVSSLAETLSGDDLQRLGEGKEPLLSFAIGSQQNLEYLLDRKIPVDATNAFGKSPLFYAVESGNRKTAEALLKAGADVNRAYKSAKELRPDNDECVYPDLVHTKRTPLMHAAQHSDIRMITILLKAGARLNTVDELGYNALDYAVVGAQKSNQLYLTSLGLSFGATK